MLIFSQYSVNYAADIFFGMRDEILRYMDGEHIFMSVQIISSYPGTPLILLALNLRHTNKLSLSYRQKIDQKNIYPLEIH